MLKLLVITTFLYFFPGLCVTIFLGIQRWRFFISLGLSLLLFATCLGTLLLWDLSWHLITIGYLFATFILLALALCKIFVNKKPELFFQHYKPQDFFILCSIFLLYGIYIFLVGPYDEVPSDVFRHLERIQLISGNLSASESGVDKKHLLPNGYYIYFLYAITWKASGVTLDDILVFFSWLNGSIVLFAVYSLSNEWLSRTFPNTKMLAFISCIFFILHQGVVQFSFVRYYALSPTMICLPIFFLAVLAFVNQLERTISKKELLLVLSAAIVPFFYHVQEALFIVITIWLLSLYYTIFYIFLELKKTDFSFRKVIQMMNIDQTPKLNNALTICAYLAILFFGVYITGGILITNESPDLNKVIKLPFDLPIVGPQYVLNPSYQFLQTIGAFGILIYVVFVVLIKKISKNSFLFMGMLIPFFTIWNPLFVDVMLRIRDVHVLYRIGYIVPFSVVGAYVTGIIYSGFSKLPSLRYASIFGWLGICIASLAPWDSTLNVLNYSRIQSLAPVNRAISYRHWEDMIWFLRSQIEARKIFTDPVTGYLVTGLTQHESNRYKFTKFRHNPINFLDYSNQPLSAYGGGLLIINLREGERSQNGRVSGHWPEDILKLKNEYSPLLLEHIKNNPTSFPLIWRNDDISIYEIYPIVSGAN